MIYGYARVSTGGQSVTAQVAELTKAGCAKVFNETTSGARTDRPQLKRALSVLGEGDVLIVTPLDRLARSTRDLLNVLAAVSEKEAQFRSLRDVWADTTTPHGRLMLTVDDDDEEPWLATPSRRRPPPEMSGELPEQPDPGHGGSTLHSPQGLTAWPGGAADTVGGISEPGILRRPGEAARDPR